MEYAGPRTVPLSSTTQQATRRTRVRATAVGRCVVVHNRVRHGLQRWCNEHRQRETSVARLGVSRALALWRAKGDAHDRRVRERVQRTLLPAGALLSLGGAVGLTIR